MVEDFIIATMWETFARGLNGGQGNSTGDLHLDWYSFGRIQGLSFGRSEKVRDLYHWMLSFDRHHVSFAQ